MIAKLVLYSLCMFSVLTGQSNAMDASVIKSSVKWIISYFQQRLVYFLHLSDVDFN